MTTYPCLRMCPCTDFVDKFNKDFVDNLKKNKNLKIKRKKVHKTCK